MGFDIAHRILLDTIEYRTDSEAACTITLWAEKKPIVGYKVNVKIGNTLQSRFFYTEEQANDYIVWTQR